MKPHPNRSLRFTGELHEVHLVNFSVPVAELRGYIPAPLKLRTFDGRAMVSMVDVQLRRMKAHRWWLPFRFNYQHVAFRILVEDAHYHPDEPGHKGIFFLRSFTDRPAMAIGGKYLTDYRLERAHLINTAGGLTLRHGEEYLQYIVAGPLEPLDIMGPPLGTELKGDEWSEEIMEESLGRALEAGEDHLEYMRDVLGNLDRAYAVRDGKVYVTQIMRERWPLVPMVCTRFETNMFKDARLEGVFKVPEVIHYTWLPAQEVATAPATPKSTHETSRPGTQFALR